MSGKHLTLAKRDRNVKEINILKINHDDDEMLKLSINGQRFLQQTRSHCS